MSQGENHERRAVSRFQSMNLISFIERNDNGEIVNRGIAKTLDLSENGAYIELPWPVTVLENVSLELALHDEIIPLDIKIVEKERLSGNTFRLRVQFDSLRPVHRHLLKKFLNELS